MRIGLVPPGTIEKSTLKCSHPTLPDEKSGGDAYRLAAFFEGRLGTVNGTRHRRREGTKAAFALPRGREVEQPFLSAFDLLQRGIVEILTKRVVDDVLTKHDQPAAQR